MTLVHLASTQNRTDIKTLTRKLLASVCLLTCGAVLAATSANAASVKKISGSSPFTNCVADNPTGQVGTLYPDSEIEPWIDVNPANTKNLIAGWQQDRWSNGGARGLAAGVSIDGGANWARIVPPKVSKCTGGIYDRASDPWVTIGPNGHAYFMSLAFMNDRPDGGFGQNAMLVSRSLNGGFTWSNPIPLIIDTSGQILNDKNAMLADPLDGNYVYAVWDRIQDFTLPSGSKSAKAGKPAANHAGDGAADARDRMRRLRALKASGKAREAPIFFKGPTYFVRSVNGGNSWEIPKKIYDPGGNAQTINNLAVVLPNGTVANFFTDISSIGATHIGIIKSANKGASFGTAALPIATNVTFSATVTPDNHEPVRDANILYDVAVDRDNGNLYLVWQDGRWGNLDRVAFSMSTDDGSTWSDPVRINMTPASPVRLRNQAFVPSVEVGANHKIVVTYYDFRFDTSDGRERTDYFAVLCTPSALADCTRRSHWGDGATRLTDIRLTGQSFDILDAPVARGHFLGDYMGLARKGNVVVPAFGIADSLNHTSIYTRPISQ
jgi:hypothetical protein